jgi:Flp pilus assembly protein TadG
MNMRGKGIFRWLGGERGQALVETAIIMPLVLLIMVGIFEVARAYQTWQVLTNAAREGARAAVVPGANPDTIKALVAKYMRDGAVEYLTNEKIDVNQAAGFVVNGTTVGATQVTVDYPFTFVVLQPVAELVNGGPTPGEGLAMRATSLMRNETQ